MKIGFIFGTRPEIIKLFPVMREFRRRGHKVCLISTGQHGELIDIFFKVFNIEPDFDFDLDVENRTLARLSADMLENLDRLFEKIRFDLVFVQGDTTSAFIGALCAFYHRIPVAHVEAGLRTDDMNEPFPEEMNRRLIGRMAVFHFAPTKRAVENLRMEGVKDENIFLVGNTVVDSLNWIVENKKDEMERSFRKLVEDTQSDRLILLTMHRRENWGRRMKEALSGIKMYLLENPDFLLIFPVHPNPVVKNVAYDVLGSLKNARLIDPVDYVSLLALIEHSRIVLTDSGGIQEEAPSFGKYVLVMRNKTERYELLEGGFGELVGTDGKRIYEALKSNMNKNMKLKEMKNPFGDGKASIRIADIVESTVM